MNALLFLIPIALSLSGLGLAGYLWAQRTGQFSDPDGSAHRILLDDDFPTDFNPAKPATSTKDQP